MKFISTGLHGMADYLIAFLLLLIPYALHYNTGSGIGQIFIALGVVTIVYSLITNYEFGILKILPMRLHLLLDVLSGMLLAASPWLFGFHGVVYMPHVLIGLIEIAVALVTKIELT